MAAYRVAALSVCLVLAMTTAEMQIRYPETRKTDQADDYYGPKVADPYRWLEDDNSAETAAWVEAQNKVTFGYLAKIPAREPLKARLTKLWNYERYGVPSREGEFYFFARNDGLQNQSVYYRVETLDAAPDVLLDPNTLSADGTVALAGTAFTDDGKLLAYAPGRGRLRLARVAGARRGDRQGPAGPGQVVEVLRRRLDQGRQRLLLQPLRRAEGRRRAAGAEPEPELYYHRLGTPQAADKLVYERPDHPTWGFSPGSPTTAATCSLYQSEGTEHKNRVFFQDLATPGATLQPFLDAFDAYYTVIDNDGPIFYVTTDRDAPRGRLVAIDLAAPQPAAWKALIAEGPNRDVLDAVTMLGDRFVVT